MRFKEVATFITCLKMSSRARAFFRRRLLASVAAALLVCAGVASVDAAVIAIARGGDAAPNSGGATFTIFDAEPCRPAASVTRSNTWYELLAPTELG